MRLLLRNERTDFLCHPFSGVTPAVINLELGYYRKDGFLLASERSELDLGILMAVDRFTTGSNAHNLRGLANAYVLAFENGQPTRAEEYRTRLLRELGLCARSAQSWIGF